MNISHFTKNPLAIAVALTLSEPPLAQATPGDFVSEIVQVNRTQGLHLDPEVDVDALGNAIIVWESQGRDDAGFDIFGQRYRAGGIQVGPPLQINSTQEGDQRNPVVAMDADGDFSVFVEQTLIGEIMFGLFPFHTIGTFFDPSGNQINRINELSIDFNFEAGRDYDVASIRPGSIAMDADGDLIAVWRSGPDRLSYAPDTRDIVAKSLQGFEKIDLKLKKKDLVDPVRRGGVIDYQLQVQNQHPTLSPTGYRTIDRAIGAASGIKLTDWIPPNTLLLSAKGKGWSCNFHVKDPQCYRNQVLLPGDRTTLNLKLRAPTYGKNVINHAEIHADQDDPNTADNWARERTLLKPH